MCLVPPEIRYHIAREVVFALVDGNYEALMTAANDYEGRWVEKWPFVSLSFTNDGFPSSVTLARKEGFEDFLGRVLWYERLSQGQAGMLKFELYPPVPNPELKNCRGVAETISVSIPETSRPLGWMERFCVHRGVR